MTVIRIRRRPTETEAVPYTGDNADEVIAWSPAHAYKTADGDLVIITDRGDAVPDPGDWVVRGLVGEHYPITPAALAAGWELAGDGS